MNNLAKNILYTIAYYDVMNFSLTAFEVWKYLITHNTKYETQNIELFEVIKELESEEVKKHVSGCKGFYFLKNNKDLVEQRLKREKISQKKMKSIRRTAGWLRFVPFIRMIAVTGRVAMQNAGSQSDLDLLIVFQKERIFTGRLLATFLVHILGKRRYADKIADRICLNYFITDQSLEIDLKDLYSSSEYAFTFPVFGEEIFKKFQEKNEWIKNWKFNYCPEKCFNSKTLKDSFFTKIIRGIGEKILGFDFIEKNLKKWQMKRILSDPRTHQKGSGVSAGDEVLIFLPQPQGPKVFEMFQKRLENIIQSS